MFLGIFLLVLRNTWFWYAGSKCVGLQYTDPKHTRLQYTAQNTVSKVQDWIATCVETVKVSGFHNREKQPMWRFEAAHGLVLVAF